MLTIKRTSQFKSSYKKLIKSGRFNNKLKIELKQQIEKLVNDIELDKKYNDHILVGQKRNIKEFHLRPDILVIYLKENNKLLLTLVQIGSHADLFGHKITY
jgi:mRNA interferase YafQ